MHIENIFILSVGVSKTKFTIIGKNVIAISDEIDAVPVV